MNTFLKLNSHKLKFASLFCAVASLSLAFIPLVIGYVKGHYPDSSLLLAILFTSVVAFPLFVIFIAYLSWLYKGAVRTKIFSKPPFNELEKIGFRNSLKGQNSRWVFTEEIKEGEINGFKIRCDISEEKQNAIEFEILNAFREIDKSEFEYLEKLFANYNGYFKFQTIAKSYTSRQVKTLTIEDVKSELQQFTMMLKQESFRTNCVIGDI